MDHYAGELAAGRLVYQKCKCGHRWLPPRDECPNCLEANWAWEEASGAGRLVSWVIYRVAYHEAFKERLPYNVAIVELAEGVRIITNIIDCPDGAGLTLDMPLKLVVEQDGDVKLARFAPADVCDAH